MPAYLTFPDCINNLATWIFIKGNLISMKYFALLAMAFMVACSSERPIKTIQITPVFNETPVVCNDSLLLNDKPWQLAQLFIYLSEFEYLNDEGQWQKLVLTENTYQHLNVALLGNSCEDLTEKNWQLAIEPIENANKNLKLRATIGVPFELNHQNPLTQSSPLNDSNMFWVWQTGHKFIRLELAAQDDFWVFHLGSTGCTSASALRAPNSKCRYPNRASIEFDVHNNNVELNLASWLESITFTDDNSCQSGLNNPTCQQLFQNLAISKNVVNESE